MSEEEILILKELSEQSDFGDLPFMYYGDLIGKLLANYNKQQKEIKLMKSININDNFISKDKILDILGYEEDDEQRKNMTIEKISSLLETIISEFNRLEDIEDRKVQVEIQNIENRRDKYWKDKIRERIKELEKNNKHYVDMISGKEIRSLDDDKIEILQELLEE